MNTLKKNSQGYGYKYTDLAEIHRHMEEVGLRYYQEIETIDGNDYIVTHILDDTDKVIRKCRGCQVVKTSGKNPAQEYGSALTYARRYSLLLAFGLATTDDDGETLNPRPDKKVVKPEKKVQPCKVQTFDRQEGVNAVKRLLELGDLQLSDVQAEVRKYGVTKMQELSNDDFRKCVATLTQG